jgi:hypothetical protein
MNQPDEVREVMLRLRPAVGESLAALCGQVLKEAKARLIVHQLRELGIAAVCLDDLEDVGLGGGKVGRA